jgi:hypothetical protein
MKTGARMRADDAADHAAAKSGGSPKGWRGSGGDEVVREVKMGRRGPFESLSRCNVPLPHFVGPLPHAKSAGEEMGMRCGKGCRDSSTFCFHGLVEMKTK